MQGMDDKTRGRHGTVLGLRVGPIPAIRAARVNRGSVLVDDMIVGALHFSRQNSVMDQTTMIYVAALVLLVLIIVVAWAVNRKGKNGAGVTSNSDTTATNNSACDSAGIRAIARLEGGNAARPGPCMDAPGGRWVIFDGAWTQAPGSEAKNGPYAKMTAEACQELCEQDPDCKSWSNNPRTNCQGYTVVPQVMMGMPGTVLGIRKTALSNQK